MSELIAVLLERSNTEDEVNTGVFGFDVSMTVVGNVRPMVLPIVPGTEGRQVNGVPSRGREGGGIILIMRPQLSNERGRGNSQMTTLKMKALSIQDY